MLKTELAFALADLPFVWPPPPGFRPTSGQ